MRAERTNLHGKYDYPDARADRAHRTDTAGGHQPARGLSLPRRALRRAAAAVTNGSKNKHQQLKSATQARPQRSIGRKQKPQARQQLTQRTPRRCWRSEPSLLTQKTKRPRGGKVDRVKTVQGVVDRMMPVGVPLSGSGLADVSSSARPSAWQLDRRLHARSVQPRAAFG